MKKNREMNFDLKELRSFIAVIEENGFTRASRRLKVGQATISHHMRSLENSLGVRLIIRNARGISVTDQGKLFRNFCEELFKSLDELTAGLSAEIPAGKTRIAASTIPATFLLPAVLARIKKKYPDLLYRLEVTDSREAVEMVKEGVAEIGIVGKEYRNPTLEFTPIFHDELVLAGPAGYPERVTVSEMVRMPFIVRDAGSGTRNAYELALSRLKIIPSNLDVVMECSGTEGILEAIAAGLGVSFVSRLALSGRLAAHALKIIAVDELQIKRDLFIVAVKSRQLSRPGKLLVEMLTESGGVAY